jgi:hypothetical protein
MLFAPYQLQPQLDQVNPNAEHALEIEKLRAPVDSMKMRYGSLYDDKTVINGLFHQLNANDTTITSQLNLVEYLTAHQAEITIYIPQRKTEENFDHVMVETPNYLPEPRIVAADLVALRHIHPISQKGI